MTRIFINGLGRMGRSIFKAALQDPEIEIVAVNDSARSNELAHLFRFDTTYGKINKSILNSEDHLYVDGKPVKVFNTTNLNELPLKDMQINLAIECHKKNMNKETADALRAAGAEKVILAGACKSDEIRSSMQGVKNAVELSNVLSTGSNTVAGIAPVLEIISRRIGIKKAITTTLHPGNSPLMDQEENPIRMKRGKGAQSNILVSTGAVAKGVWKMIPELTNKTAHNVIVVPAASGAMAEITINTERNTSLEEINNIFREEAGSERYMGILGVNVEPLLSCDIMHDPRASVVDLSQTQVVEGDLVKIAVWYDPEMGYAIQLLKEAKRMATAVPETNTVQ